MSIYEELIDKLEKEQHDYEVALMNEGVGTVMNNVLAISTRREALRFCQEYVTLDRFTEEEVDKLLGMSDLLDLAYYDWLGVNYGYIWDKFSSIICGYAGKKEKED